MGPLHGYGIAQRIQQVSKSTGTEYLQGSLLAPTHSRRHVDREAHWA
jgi:hypothetical protein